MAVDHEAFWRDLLAGHPVTPLPRWAAEPDGGPVRAGVWMPGGLAGLARALDEPVTRLVLAAFVRVVAMVTGEADVVIGHRARAGEPLVPLRAAVPGGSWRELVDGIATAERAVAAHRGAPPQDAGPHGGGLLFDVGFGPAAQAGPDDVALAVDCAAGRVSVSCRGQLFDAGYAARFAGYLNAAMAAMIADPAAPCQAADLLSDGEREQLRRGLSGPRRPLPPDFAAALFEQQAHRQPGAVAVSCRGQQWSYDRVNRTANQIAHALLAAGLQAEDVVAVVTQRDPLWLCAVIGVLKAGGAYLPAEPEFPASRVAELVSRSRCRFLLTGPDGPAGAVPGVVGLWSRPVPELLRGTPGTDPGIRVQAGQLAYIYFTSGSTGTPKGAMCEHIGLLNHLTAKVTDFGLGPGDVVVQNARQSFDISLWQLLAPLTVGGRTLIMPGEVILDVARFVAEVVAGDTTVLQVVPSYLDVLLCHLEQHPTDLGRLRYVCVTGEAISRPLVDRWFARHPRIALVNAYGATEASDDTTHEVMSAPPPGALVPVGRPVGNVTVYVLGPGATLRPLGTPGEIAFSGVCVGRGYVNDAGRTARAFTPDPFRPGERMYRTGDFGRWLPSGSLEFLGRTDEQVKIHGVRIELGEVESQLLAHPLVRAAAVVAIPLPGAGKELVAFYSGDTGLRPDRLRAHLADALPAAAVPARISRIEALPLTGNGKVDKRRLTSLASQSAAWSGRGAPVRPRTATQRRIASAWAQAMDRPVEEIGCDDDFFGLGGSSLSALRVVASLNGLVSLDDLVRNPVLSALSSVADGAAPDPGGLLRLLAATPGRAAAALVCVPTAAGLALSFSPLATELAARAPQALAGGIAVYAVQLPGHDPGRAGQPLRGLDEVVKLLADELAAVDAPLVLWGHGTGAPVAVELAVRLGEPVRHLFVAARLLSPPAELAREAASAAAASDADLAARVAELGGLNGLDGSDFDGLSPAEVSFIGRAYRHDTREASQYLMRAPQARWDKPSCPATVVVGTSDPSTRGYGDRFRDWGTFSAQVTLAELDGAGHDFPRTHPAGTAEVIIRVVREIEKQ
jgi:amino acid adenylation domain-containing protein